MKAVIITAIGNEHTHITTKLMHMVMLLDTSRHTGILWCACPYTSTWDGLARLD